MRQRQKVESQMFELRPNMMAAIESFINNPTSATLKTIYSLCYHANWIPLAFTNGCKAYPDDSPDHSALCRKRKCPLLGKFASFLGKDHYSGMCGLTYIRRAMDDDFDQRNAIPMKKMAKYILMFQQVIPMLEAAREIYGQTPKQRKSKTG